MDVYILIYIIGYILAVIMLGYIILLETNITLGNAVLILLISLNSWVMCLITLIIIIITKINWNKTIIKKK